MFRTTIVWLSFCAACVTTSVSGPEPVFFEAPTTPSMSDGGLATARARGFALAWGKSGAGPGEFRFPIGIAINAADEVFVSDYRNTRIQKFDTQGRFVSSFAVLPYPGALAVDKSGNLYITHFAAFSMGDPAYPARVSVYTQAGAFVREWGRTGTGDGEFDFPGGISISPDGRVYVADQTNRRVQVFDVLGTFLTKWGEYGTDAGQFGGNVTPSSRTAGPQFVAVDSRGEVVTTEGSLGRIQRFDRAGRHLSSFGNNDDREGGFGSGAGMKGPIGIIVDKEDCLWISSAGGRVQRFSREGAFLQGFGRTGTGPGEFNIPHALAVDSRGDLYVTDALNHRVQKFVVSM